MQLRVSSDQPPASRLSWKVSDMKLYVHVLTFVPCCTYVGWDVLFMCYHHILPMSPPPSLQQSQGLLVMHPPMKSRHCILEDLGGGHNVFFSKKFATCTCA